MKRALFARALLVAACAVVILPAAALAQAAVAASPTVDAGSLFGTWRPYLVELASVAAFAIVGLLAELARRKLGLSIEQSHRQALQTAITNAAGLALNALGNRLEGKTVSVHSALIADAINYVNKSAPDALAKFGLTPTEVGEKIVAKLPQIANTTPPPAPPAG